MSKLGKLLEDWFGWCNHDWTKWEWRTTTKHFHISGEVIPCTVEVRACKKCGHGQVRDIQRV